MTGGFTPGLASVLRSGTGERLFVKAARSQPNPQTQQAHRREARIVTALPSTVPAPRMLWWDEIENWTVLVFEYVAGVAPRPGDPVHLAHVLRAVETLAEVLTPSPVNAPPLSDDAATDFRFWRATLEAGTRLSPRFGSGLDDAVPALAALEQQWSEAARGDSLLHGDLRLDNMLITRRGAVVVDWPNACVAAPWVDLALMVPNLAWHGVDVHPVLEHHSLLTGLDRDAVDAVLSAHTGYLLAASMKPPPRGIPAVRDFQAQQGAAGLRVIARRRPHLGIG